MDMKQFIKRLAPKGIKNLYHLLCAWYGAVKYHYPSEEMLVIGVTGTTGKSSVIHFLRQVLESAGYKVGSLSTVDFYVAGETKMNDQKMTMLGKTQIQKYLREMADAGCDIAILETTSEGYLQSRHRFINYDTIVLTGLYPEHIEAHGGFENYKKAKLGIFEYVASQKGRDALQCVCTKSLKSVKTAIVNGDSEYANEFLSFGFDKKILFRMNTDTQIDANAQITDHRSLITHLLSQKHSVDSSGLHFFLNDTQFDAPLYGEYNIMNLLAVIAVARELDISWSVIQKAIANIKSAPGRIEFIKEAETLGFKVIVDYAYEPKALEGLYKVVDLLKPKRVIHVCGSTGGGRDKGRRAPIGELVGQKADVVIVTNEDPYDEDPVEIIKQVSAGAQKVGKMLDKNLFEILDRREAIAKAIGLAKKGDLVLVTGKGSEQAMCVGGGKMVAWDDRGIVKEILQKLNRN